MTNKWVKGLIWKSFARGLFIIAAPWLSILVLRELGPVRYPPTSESLKLFLSLSILFQIVFYVFGYLASSYDSSSPKLFNHARFTAEKQRALNLFFCLTLAYISFAAIDYFLIKGANFGGIVELREQENLDGPRNSVIGLLSAVLSAAPALLAVSIISGVSVSRRQLHMFSVVSLVGIGGTFLSGGRNSFFLSIGYLFSYWMVGKSGQFQLIKSLISRKFIYSISMFVFVVIFYSLTIFLKRFELRGMTPLDMLQHYNTDYIGEISMPGFDNEFFVSCYVAFSIFIYYLTHSLSYLDIYLERANYVTLYGAYNFPVPFRIVDLLFESKFFDDLMNETIGVYLTFPGSLFLDFSYFGAIVGVSMIAFVFGRFYRRREFVFFRTQLLGALVVLTILFSPFYTAFALGNGFSFLVLTVLVYLLLNVRFKF